MQIENQSIHEIIIRARKLRKLTTSISYISL